MPSKKIQTIKSKYPIIDFSLNKNKDKIATTSLRYTEGKSRLTISQDKNFKKSKTIYFHNEISSIEFSRQSDEIILAVKDGLISLPEDFEGDKIDTLNNSDTLKIIRNKKKIGKLPVITFPSKITRINSFINRKNQEIWMIGLENGEGHILNEDKSKVSQILICGNYAIHEIQRREISFKDEIIISDDGAIYIFNKGKTDEIFNLHSKLETKTPVTSLFFNNEANVFFSVGANGFIKKWFTDYQDIFEKINIGK